MELASAFSTNFCPKVPLLLDKIECLDHTQSTLKSGIICIQLVTFLFSRVFSQVFPFFLGYFHTSVSFSKLFSSHRGLHFDKHTLENGTKYMPVRDKSLTQTEKLLFASIAPCMNGLLHKGTRARCACARKQLC